MTTTETLQGLLMKDYKLHPEQLGREVELSTLGIDSLGLIELVFQIEETFGVEASEENMPTLRTFGDVVIYVDSLVSAKQTPRKTTAPAVQVDA